MKTKRFNRKSIAFLFAMVVFFCGIQSRSFAQAPTLIVSDPAFLTEETLDNSIVKLTIVGDVFEDDINTNRVSVVPLNWGGINENDVKRLSDTEISVRLRFSGNFDRDRTLTLRVDAWGLKNYKGEVTATIPIIVTIESLTATSTPAPLTEATLHNSTVTLTLRGRTFKAKAGAVTISGISGVTVGSIKRLSDTELAVRLWFDGQDFDHDRTLTFTITDRSIKNYHHIPVSLTSPDLELTAELPVSATVERQTPVAPTPQPTVVSTPPSRWAFRIRNPTRVTQYYQVLWSSNGSWQSSSLGAGGILNHWWDVQNVPSGYPQIRFDYIAGDQQVTYRSYTLETAQLPENTDVGGNTDVPTYHFEYNQQGDRIDLRRTTPQPSVVSTPQPTVVVIPNRNLRTAIQQEIGNTITTQTLLNLTGLGATALGIRDLTGLEHATNLGWLHLDHNSISDVSALSGLPQLTDLYLDHNNISDISPLVGLPELYELYLEGNPLNAAAINTHIPAMQANGVEVEFDNRTPTTSPAVEVKNPQVETRTPTIPIDPSQPAIYWTNPANRSIQRANLDGSNVTTLVSGVDPWNIALDVAGGKMYWIVWDSIQRANLDGSNVETLVTQMERKTHLVYLTLDVSGGKMYWINRQYNEDGHTLRHKIHRANLDGSNIETLRTGEKGATSLALDVSGGKMYWVHRDPAAADGIQRANLDGSNVETLVTQVGPIINLILDPPGGKMYWRENRLDMNRNLLWSKIYRANLNGSNVETLVKSNYAAPFTVDMSGGKIYWRNYEHRTLSKIHRVNLDGSNVETLAREEYISLLTLDVAGGKMYWGGRDGDDYKIQRANLDGSNIEDIITEKAGSLTLIPSQAPVDDASPSAVRKTTQVHVDAADRPSMYWIDTAAGTLHRLIDAEVENLLPSVRNANSLTLDVANDKLYWTEKTSNTTGRIRSANLDGTNVQLVKDLTSVPFDITFNPVDSKLYLTNSWGKVQRLNLDGSGFQSNLITDLDTPMNITVDVVNDKLYWTEKTSNTTGRIRSANLDGTNIQLIKDLTSVPLDIALDAADGKLYLANSWGKVQRLNLDGSGFQSNFITDLATPMNIAVDTVGQQLYLTSGDGKISRRDLSGGGSEAIVEGLVSPGNIVLNNSITAPEKSATSETPASKNKYDVNGDGTVNDADASLVSEAISNGSTDAKYDVNSDGQVNFDDLKLVLDNRAEGAAGAPLIVGNLKLNASQIARIEAQIDLLLATGDQSPAAIRTLIYLQQLLTTARPEKTQLFANYPNPFNPETWIPYQLAEPAEVTVSIYAIDGKLVRTLALGHQSAGIYQYRNRAAYWDGRNNVGEPVASGLYFYTLTAGDFTATRKMLIKK